MSDRATVEFLAGVPLLQGGDEADLMALAPLLRRRRVAATEVLWRQGDVAREMVFVVEGAVSVFLHAPGGQELEIATAGRGEMLGELALLDGGEHTMTVRAVAPSTVLVLSRVDFTALVTAPGPWPFEVKRRLATLLTERHRSQLRQLGASIGTEEAGSPDDDAPAPADLKACGPPDSRYLRRMATFHDFDSLALWGFLTSGTYARCPAERTLLVEGAPATACYLTINGAVDKVLIRGDRRIRVGLAGPGKAFGYESLIDGEPSPVTAITRERVLLLVIASGPFRQLFAGEDAISRVFLDVIQRDLVSTLRQTLRPQARLAASL